MTFGIDILKKYVRLYERRLEPESLRILAESYWRGLLLIALCALVFLVAFGFWQFIGVLDDLAGAQDTGTKPPLALNRTMLESTLAAFDARQERSQRAPDGAGLKDPSK